MQSLKTFLVGLSALVAVSSCAAEGLVTLTVHGSAANYVTNEVQIASYQQAVIKTYLAQDNLYSGGAGSSRLNIFKTGTFLEISPSNFQGKAPITIAGPATIQLVALNVGDAVATVDITPSSYPPDRAVTVGPYSADMKVTMEMSTDLVNWTVAQNAAVYTNRPEARFFRIKLEKDIPAP